MSDNFGVRLWHVKGWPAYHCTISRLAVVTNKLPCSNWSFQVVDQPALPLRVSRATRWLAPLSGVLHHLEYRVSETSQR